MMWKNVMIYLVLTALCWQFELTNSRTSTLWKLNTESGKITTGANWRNENCNSNSNSNRNINKSNNKGERYDFAAAASNFGIVPSLQQFDANAEVYANDEVFYIIASTLSEGSAGWIRQSPENMLESMVAYKTNSENYTKNGSSSTSGDAKKITPSTSSSINVDTALIVEETLDCGKPVNFTYYDYLIGVGQRFNHPLVPEPEVAYLFLKTKDENSYKNFDITALERRLKRAKREKPRSVQLYNQIGNYWRIIGDARQAIECFRRALAMSPTNAEVLLNLARVLYNLQYLDDAIHLTRRSLEMQPPGRSAWQQYFTLGEIFKAYGHFQESILHLRHALELYPQHEPILKALRDVENNPSSTLHVYTVVIIIALVVAVFVVIITSSSNCENCNPSSSVGTGSGSSSFQNDLDARTNRHFNRAMAMRSLKGLSSRHFRHRKN